MCSQDTSLSGQFVQRWRLRIMAQEAALKEVAKRKLRRLLAYNDTVDCAYVEVDDTFFEASHRESAPRWRGPA